MADYLRCGRLPSFRGDVAVREFCREAAVWFGNLQWVSGAVRERLAAGGSGNRGLKFVCRLVPLRIETIRHSVSSAAATRQRITVPVAHGEAATFATIATLACCGATIA